MSVSFSQPPSAARSSRKAPFAGTTHDELEPAPSASTRDHVHNSLQFPEHEDQFVDDDGFGSPRDEFDVAPSASMKEHVRDGHMFASEGSDAGELGDRFGKTFSFTGTFDWFDPGSPVKRRSGGRARNLHGLRSDSGDHDGNVHSGHDRLSFASTKCSDNAHVAFVDPDSHSDSPKRTSTDGEASASASEHGSACIGSIEIQSVWDKGQGTASCSQYTESTACSQYVSSPTSAMMGAEQVVSPTSYASCDPSQFSASPLGTQQISLMMMLPGRDPAVPPPMPPPAPPHILPAAPQGMSMPPAGMLAPCAHGGFHQLPNPYLANPPGAWMHGEQPLVTAPPGAAAIRLVRAARPPPPLNHNKGHAVTSLTINHLPFQMRQSQLCTLLNETGFAALYNYVYMPCNHDKTNRGHAFVNFRTPQDAKDFFAGWHGARVVGAGSDSPILSVAVSVVQGFEASIQKWTVAKMLRLKDPDFRPFISGMPA